MNFADQKEKLKEIYNQFEIEVYEFKKKAICKAGCAYCCTHFGNLDITTLEGVIMRERIDCLSRPLRTQINKKLAQNKRRKENEKVATCPFLNKNDTCMIYDVRPFSCRQLYSVKACRGNGPTVHRQAAVLAKEAIKEIQLLDNTGYSGHISYILYLLDKDDFRNLYLSGGIDPAKIAAFGKSHGIFINRMAK
jgi:Fe-S-cluster containining protein